MSEKDNQDVDSTISTEQSLDTLRDSIDDPTVLRDQLKKEAEARRQLTARAKKAEAERKEALEKLTSYEAKDQSKEITNKPPTETETKMDKTIDDEVVDLRLDGYSKEEVAWIMKNGGRKELEDANSYTSIAINARREQKKAEEAASATKNASGQSEIERRFTSEQLQKMTVAELEATLPHAE